MAVAGCLWFYRREYPELRERISARQSLTAILVGAAVFVVWILPEGLYPQLGDSEFNPMIFDSPRAVWILVAFRLAGAVLVVPVFEELFWRSFLLRWVIKPDFLQVELGKFTWLSFAVVTLFFGLEHNRWLVGLFAGAAYKLADLPGAQFVDLCSGTRNNQSGPGRLRFADAAVGILVV